MLQFIIPPMPHYIVGGEDTYLIGDSHAARSNIRVFDLLLVMRGRLYLEEEGTTYAVKGGSFLILRPDCSHRSTRSCEEETHFYWIHFQTVGDWHNIESGSGPVLARTDSPVDTIDPFSIYLPRLQTMKSPEQIEARIQQLFSLQAELDASARWKQQQLFLELLTQLQDDTKRLEFNPRLLVAEKAAAYVRLHFKETLSYKQLSDHMHFHSNYIALCMKSIYGCTPLEYLTLHRVEQAKRLLIHTEEPVGTIAMEVGFGSFPYFVRCFGRIAGCNPKAYRRRFRV